MKKIMEVKHLTKKYGDFTAVDDLSLHLNEGEILGLLGPNGAGKSTTINILSTILKSDTGEITVFGLPYEKNIKVIKERMGIVPQEIALYEEISAYKNVEFFASLYNVKKAELHEKTLNALEFVGLLEHKDDKPKTFSGGMKRRLNIACALAHEPDLLILDEPTVGIDPQSRNHILRSLKKLQQQGKSIIYTTHYMEEVAEIADRIIIIDHGNKIAEGTLKKLLAEYRNTIKYTFYLNKINKDILTSLENIKGVEKLKQEENILTITLSKEQANLDKIILTLVNHECKIEKMETQEGNLEMVFLELTGRKLRD